MNLSKKWKLYVLHHSHTDIGYTERQEKLKRYHVDFIQQAIDILTEIENGKRPEWEGFRWVCENYWQVENFLENSSEENIACFERYVQAGLIDISLNYLNMTELVDNDVLNHKLAQGRSYADSLAVPLDSAMTADINGFSWGYADALANNGIENLFSCIHTHHGMFPVGKKHHGFWWEGPSGERVLTWVSDHYHMGNELCLVPKHGITYLLEDRFNPKAEVAEFEVAEERIFKYIEKLDNDVDYDYDFVPLMVSGMSTDNGAPNGQILERIKKWNDLHGEQIEIEMITLNHFFEILREEMNELPVYRGDWNDWWADGVGSTPAVVKHYKDAQRKYHIGKQLAPDFVAADKKYLDEVEYELTLYAEHTWGYSSSVTEPWETLVNDLDFRKSAYAIRANQLASLKLDEILAAKGEVTIRPDREKLFKVINPQATTRTDSVCLYIEHWEDVEGAGVDILLQNIEVVDEATGKVLPSQVREIARAKEVEVVLELAALEERILRVRLKKELTKEPYRYLAVDKVKDVMYDGWQEGLRVNAHQVETAYYSMVFDETKGIVSMIDKQDGASLLRDNLEHAPFVGIYERTPTEPDAWEVRHTMGRNRKKINTNRYVSKLRNIKVSERGEVSATIVFTYDLEGTQMYEIHMKVYRDTPKIDVTLRLHKDSVWDPENLYISFPFTTGGAEELYFDKTGCLVRPGVDQLPGTNQEFYLLQEGAAYVGTGKSVILALKDTPLLVLGDLEHHLIELAGQGGVEKNKEPLYVWVMNNFWETNFKVDLAGFYEFRYTLSTLQTNQADVAIDACKSYNQGFLSMYV
ncbi:glycoside hydrolase family 38 N-terminal domain-containing protein [Listeria seeligeri]|uniref:glycoside hydrolase family 38 N-terminal domain-containing protein n=1 Tax=Listeria seeligeri TaxID=1640 RepID=UPI0016266E1C|nr:glycoside hydrolase family 38 C-terminal domain-containing protein [Listeria seeligeri]MBC1582281.1 glycosyl hydrolase [Listeria seeligeri]MBC2202615.1 glycosyl hydrolase [Listeria seeligeri]MBC2209365.1 glycosyl hydrolase [Listeria seeligeri]MBF2384414.1 glycosyl hydrolase [Listeria seeligeri]